jgi:hypothetical protein
VDKGGRCIGLTTLPPFLCRLFWNLGTSTSWNPQDLSRPVMGLLYLLLLSFRTLRCLNFVMERARVYCAVRAVSLNIFQVNFPLCDMCDGERDAGTGFSPSTSVSPCQYHSTKAPYSSPAKLCSQQKTKKSRPQKSVLFQKSGFIVCENSFHSPSLKG